MQYDRALVTAMVERWRPETHCFHLPFGEVTITLQDVQVLFGLRIDGDVVYMQDAARRIRPWRTLLETLTGCAIAPADMDGASKYNWGSAVLAYLYRALCRASIDNVVDICGFIHFLQFNYFVCHINVWCWERILPVQPSAPPPHDGDILLPYARRWTRAIDRDTESHHVLFPIRD
ncbi:serine/threonine-protein phosphatase 7 long form homolog [Solanum stenotomum]|uniref:serine/threonine-protein phosphatase 7 long form homolog n=1 Tax=Solanum stenotomum TaxID=172797 RepID=UPI0020D1818E|nr:serine/threonine-protein phosphatase 7 long form homolog [Solanum stenotomum]